MQPTATLINIGCQDILSQKWVLPKGCWLKPFAYFLKTQNFQKYIKILKKIKILDSEANNQLINIAASEVNSNAYKESGPVFFLIFINLY